MPDGTEFSFETLSKTEALERKQPRLQKIEPSFWDHLQSYLSRLGSSLRAETERNASSRKIALLQDELRNASRKAESFWEAREKKITLQALKSARDDDAPAPENSLKSEQALYHDLVKSFRTHTPAVVASLEDVTEPTPPPKSVAPVAPAPSPVPVPPAPTKGADESLTVRALVDIPPFVGLDGKTYRLKRGDVLTLPRRMVDMLARRGQVSVVT